MPIFCPANRNTTAKLNGIKRFKEIREIIDSAQTRARSTKMDSSDSHREEVLHVWQSCKVSTRLRGLCAPPTPTLCCGVTAFTPVHLERGRGRGARERTEEKNSRGRESEYNETARKTLREPLHHTVCQNHCCPSIDQQDGPPLQTGLVLFTEPRLVRPGKSHQLGRSSRREGAKPVLLKSSPQSPRLRFPRSS